MPLKAPLFEKASMSSPPVLIVFAVAKEAGATTAELREAIAYGVIAPSGRAKNFALDVMAGVRYMFTKHIGAFVEYKYNHQWDVEIESHPFYLPNGTVGRGTAHLDFDCHKVVLGLAYHW